jgi:hypothetical protein
VIVVLYTKDLEPITCVDLPVEVQEEIERVGIGKIPVLSKLGADISTAKMLYIRPLKILGPNLATHVFFVTQEEELALSVSPQWLPGQLPLVQRWQQTIALQQKQLRRPDAGFL